MRSVWGISAAVLLLAFAGHVLAQGIPDRAAIKVQEAEVRSGHGTGPKFYATNKLRYGDVVEVTKTLDDGWLEIMPPPQSFSWINARMLEQLGTNVWVVKGDQRVDVYYGSSLHEAKPDVRSTSVAVGTQVVSIGKPKAADDGQWLPIQPPLTERRYILAEALGRTSVAPRSPAQPVEANWPQPPPDGQAKATSRVGAPSDGLTAAQTAGSYEALVKDAQAAEKAGDYGSAIKSWEDVARASDKANPAMAQNCRNHIQWLRNRINNIEAGNGPMPRTNERVAPRPSNNYGGGASGATPATAAPAYNGTSRSYSQGSAADANRDGQPPPKTKRVGQLQQAAWSPDSKPVYRLVSSDRQTYITVLPQQGVDLTPFLNRNVELEGTIEYHSEPRKTYLVTTAVNLLP